MDVGSLYPAMPYTSYAYISPDDVKALYAYFMQGVERPVKQENKARTFRGRCRCAGPVYLAGAVRARMSVTTATPPPVASGDPGAARALPGGRAGPLQRPSHACATVRPAGKGIHRCRRYRVLFLSGAVVEGWLAKNLRGDVNSGLGSWSKRRHRRFPEERPQRALRRVRRHGPRWWKTARSTWSDADLNAIAAYLKTLAPADKGDAQKPRLRDATGQALRKGKRQERGRDRFPEQLRGLATAARARSQHGNLPAAGAKLDGAKRRSCFAHPPGVEGRADARHAVRAHRSTRCRASITD